MQIRQMLVSPSKYSIKCPNSMVPEYITIHNTANDASANNEVSYMIGNSNQTSFHVAVDDKEAVQGIPFNRNAWHGGDGNGNGNRKSIGIEVCCSKSGGDRFSKAEDLTAELVAQLLKERGWGIERVKKHQDWSGKYCPHRTLDLGWDRFLNRIKSKLNSTSTNSSGVESEDMAIFQYLGVNSFDEARSRLKEHLGEKDSKCDWGCAENDRGGYLGSGRRDIARLQSELEIVKNRPQEIKEIVKEVPVEKIITKEVIKEVPVEKVVEKIIYQECEPAPMKSLWEQLIERLKELFR